MILHQARSVTNVRLIHRLKYSTAPDSFRIEPALKYCKDLTRQRDYDAYLCVPFFPAHQRNTQYALRAFNVELASIRENVSKPEIGKMRMQFWKDTLDKVYAVST
ncbi:hypothetical protein RMATCC62417_13691 [Rhizopus microsporus]|nr:hypothetical protein RMATCC62417_13691 [Rhizopus microsporus]